MARPAQLARQFGAGQSLLVAAGAWVWRYDAEQALIVWSMFARRWRRHDIATSYNLHDITRKRYLLSTDTTDTAPLGNR